MPVSARNASNSPQRSILGDDCYLQNGITIGSSGVADNTPEGRRHPWLGNGAQVGRHSSLLGPITVGDDVFIGPYQVVNRDIPARSRLTIVQELLIERVLGSGEGRRPEIHAVLPDVAAGTLRVIGANLERALVAFTDSASGGEVRNPHAWVVGQQASHREIVVGVRFAEDDRIDTVALTARTPDVSLTLFHSLSLKRALEALRGGSLDA